MHAPTEQIPLCHLFQHKISLFMAKKAQRAENKFLRRLRNRRSGAIDGREHSLPSVEERQQGGRRGIGKLLIKRELTAVHRNAGDARHGGKRRISARERGGVSSP